MNLLSILALLGSYSLLLSAIYSLHLNRYESLNRTAALVNLCFSWWAF